MKKIHGLDNPNYVPDYIANSVQDIDFKKLRDEGIRYVAIDVDNTLVPNFGTQMDESAQSFLRKELPHFKESWIATNRFLLNLQYLAEGVGVKLFQATLTLRKPQKRYFRQLLKNMGDPKPSEVVMIGDNLWADIWGANRLGFRTILVKPLSHDFWFVTLLRIRTLEKKLLKKYIP